MHSESYILWRPLQSHRKEGEVALFSFVGKCDCFPVKLLLLLPLGHQAHASCVGGSEEVWHLLEDRSLCRAIAGVWEITRVSEVPLACSLVDLHASRAHTPCSRGKYKKSADSVSQSTSCRGNSDIWSSLWNKGATKLQMFAVVMN